MHWSPLPPLPQLLLLDPSEYQLVPFWQACIQPTKPEKAEIALVFPDGIAAKQDEIVEPDWLVQRHASRQSFMPKHVWNLE